MQGDALGVAIEPRISVEEGLHQPPRVALRLDPQGPTAQVAAHGAPDEARQSEPSGDEYPHVPQRLRDPRGPLLPLRGHEGVECHVGWCRSGNALIRVACAPGSSRSLFLFVQGKSVAPFQGSLSTYEIVRKLDESICYVTD